MKKLNHFSKYHFKSLDSHLAQLQYIKSCEITAKQESGPNSPFVAYAGSHRIGTQADTQEKAIELAQKNLQSDISILEEKEHADS